MKMVRLPNRYGAFVHLERAGRRAFKLCGNFQYMSNLGERDNIQAVDPDGGPFIAVGGKVAGMEVESILDEDLTRRIMSFDIFPALKQWGACQGFNPFSLLLSRAAYSHFSSSGRKDSCIS